MHAERTLEAAPTVGEVRQPGAARTSAGGAAPVGTPAQLLALQCAAGNRAASALVGERMTPTIQRDYEPLRHPGVLDNGMITRPVTASVGGSRRTLAVGTYVEVLARLPADRLRVRVWSGHHGAVALMPAAAFRHEPQLDDRRDTHHERTGGAVDDVGYRTPHRRLRLWADSGPDYRDVRQARLGDCYLMAAAAGIALSDPGRIRAMFPVTEPGLPHYSVLLYRTARGAGSGGQSGVGAGRRLVTVDTEMPRGVSGRTIPATAALVSGIGYRPAPAAAGRPAAGEYVLWPFVLEKAIAEVLGGYDDLSEGGEHDREDAVFRLLTGRSLLLDVDWVGSQGTGQPSDWREMSDGRLLQTLHHRLSRGDVVTCGTSLLFETAPTGTGLLTRHAYTLVSVDAAAGLLRLRNPHGVRHPEPLTVAQFRAGITHISYGDLAEDLSRPPGRRSGIPLDQ